MRLQCELARRGIREDFWHLDRDHVGAFLDAECLAILQRAKELLAAHRKEWLAVFTPERREEPGPHPRETNRPSGTTFTTVWSA